MERNKIKIAFGFGIFSVFFMTAVLLLITNFVSRVLVILAMSTMNYSTNVPPIVEPILVILSGVCFIISIFALVISLWFIKKY